MPLPHATRIPGRSSYGLDGIQFELMQMQHELGEVYDNAVHLDEFYINAAGGIDGETGEVVNKALERASYRDARAYQSHAYATTSTDS